MFPLRRSFRLARASLCHQHVTSFASVLAAFARRAYGGAAPVVLLLLCIVLAACNVSEAGVDTGGLGGALGLAGAPACGRGVAVVLSDYSSTQIALVDRHGRTETASLISTASSRTDGLSFALSGDVSVPSTAPRSGRVIVLDRYGTNVLTFIDPYSGRVQHQLPVGTGFDSNPQDYLEAAGRAFVARFGRNPTPGRESFDDGGDLLVLDPSTPRISGQILLPTWDELPSRPSALALIGGDVVVTLARISLDFRTTGTAGLALLSPEDERVEASFDLEPYKNCSRATLSPDAEVFAIVCSGALDQTGAVGDLEQSGILLFSAVDRPLLLLDEISAIELGEGALQPDAAFFSNEVLLVKTQTRLHSEDDNRLLAIDLALRSAETLLEAAPSDSGQGKGIVYGGLHCPGTCEGVCLLADADRGVLQRISAGADGRPQVLTPVRVEEGVGLPPVGLGPF